MIKRDHGTPNKSSQILPNDDGVKYFVGNKQYTYEENEEPLEEGEDEEEALEGED